MFRQLAPFFLPTVFLAHTRLLFEARERWTARHQVRNPNTHTVVYLLGHDCVPIVAHAVILPLGGIAEGEGRRRGYLEAWGQPK